MYTLFLFEIELKNDENITIITYCNSFSLKPK